MNKPNSEFDQLIPERVLPDSLPFCYYKSKESNDNPSKPHDNNNINASTSNIDLISKYKEYKVSRKVIEIIPYDADHFDIISFIDFAIAVDSDYATTTGFKKIHNSTKIYINLFPRCMIEDNYDKKCPKYYNCQHPIDNNSNQETDNVEEYPLESNNNETDIMDDRNNSNILDNNTEIDEVTNEESLSHKNDKLLYSFHVVIEQNFKRIQVFIKNNMNLFHYEKKDERECIVLPYVKYNNLNLYGISDDFTKNSLMFRLGKYFGNLNIKCPPWLRSIFVNFQCEKTRIKKQNIGETNDLIKMLSSFPRRIGLMLQSPIEKGFNIELDIQSVSYPWITSNIKSIKKIPVTFSVQSITILFPWARNVLNQCDFLEMDGSFKGAKPYTFCVADAIFNNESYPIGLSICPSELELLNSWNYGRRMESKSNVI